MSSFGGKGDGQEPSPKVKQNKVSDKAKNVKNYYKKKYEAAKQQDGSSSPGENAQSSSGGTPNIQTHPLQGYQAAGGSSGKRTGGKGGNSDPNWHSYGQMKNQGRRDLSADFEQNCSIQEGSEQHRPIHHPPSYEREGNRPAHKGARGGHQVNSPRQSQGRGCHTSSPNRPYTPKGKGNANQKRAKCFEEYWKKEDVQAGLKRGQLVEGPVRINPNNYEEAFVAHPDGQSDLYVRGMSTRNRALNGDWVAVCLDPRENWRVNIGKMEESADALTKLVDKCRNTSLSENSDVVIEEEYEESEGESESHTLDNSVLKAAAKTTDGNLKTNGKSQKDATTTKVTEMTGVGPPDDKNPLNEKDKSNHKGSANVSTKGAEPGTMTDSGKNPRKPGEKSNATNTPQKRKTYTALKDLGTQNSGSSKLEVIFSPTKIADKLEVVHEAIPDEYLQRTGKVVYITEKKHSRACTGHIRPSTRAKFALFSPTDHRVPRINIPVSECPQGFQERPEDHTKTLYVARITDWNDDQQMPLGTLARSLGEAGEIEPETEGILISYDVDFGEFPQACVDCLPPVSAARPWTIPQSEFAYRRDFRKECVFTIDPPTARDLDDALHVNDLGNDEYEVGVHIADVSYFVEHGTALDTVAASRATSVYLVQKVVPMLPRLLCEQLCSLNPAEDRLTFSVVWRITGRGEIKDEWFGRSVIRSCVKMGYNHAQGFLDDPERDWTQAELPPISSGYQPQLIKEKVLILNKIAKELRRKRYDGGALSLNQVKMQFTLDKQTGMPCGYSVYEQKDSNRLIEEFMLLANMAVARKIYETFPESAVLRRHPPPQQKMVDELQELLASLGKPLDCSSAKHIQDSLRQYTGGNEHSEAQCQILTALCSKAMQLAKYFCTGMYDDSDLYRHYALSVPLYTHFTSPIRRYPDVMVHRALAAALGYMELPNKTQQDIQKQCTHCNDKKIAAKSVQDLSNNLYFAAFVKECGPLEERGMVMGLTGKCFDVLLLNLGVVKRVFVEQLSVESAEFHVNQKRPELKLLWKADTDHPTPERQILEIFTPVKCVLTADTHEPLKFNCLLKHPSEPLVSTHLPDLRPEDTSPSAIVVNYEDV